MTTQAQYFMADFAKTDRRSSHAHLKGRNVRVYLFRAFATAEALVGRKAKAEADYSDLSWFLYYKIPLLRRIKEKALAVLIPVAGLAGGAVIGLRFHQ